MPHKFNTTRDFESQTCPGVTFVMRKMTEGRKLKYNDLVAEPTKQIREAMSELKRIQIKKDEDPTKDWTRLYELNDLVSKVVAEKVNPIKVVWGVSAVEGLFLDDKKATLDDLMDWPSELVTEVVAQIDIMTGLSVEEAKN